MSQEITKQNIESIVEQNEIVFLDFWAQWCAPCRTFSQVYDKVAGTHSDIIFGKINVEEQPQLAEDFQVRSIPMLVVFKQGDIIFADAGDMPEVALRDLVAQAQAADITKES